MTSDLDVSPTAPDPDDAAEQALTKVDVEEPATWPTAPEPPLETDPVDWSEQQEPVVFDETDRVDSAPDEQHPGE